MKTRHSTSTSGSYPERIVQTTVPEPVSELLADYDYIVGEREHFLWQWLYYLFPKIQLSCVQPAYSETVRDAKLLASLYVVVLDDLAELAQDERTYREAAKVPFGHQSPDTTRHGVDAEVVEFTTHIWERVEAVVRSSPRSEEFRDLLLFDVEQTLTAIEYTFLTNEHLDLASVEEATIYDSHNMLLFPYVDLDLLYSPTFDRDDLGALRKITRRAQEMARIGNWVTTWERELGEGDFSSGVVLSALETGVVSTQQLEALRDDRDPDAREAIAERIHESGIEAQFLQRWADHHREIETYESDLVSVDVESFLGGIDHVLECQIAIRRLK